LPSHPHCTAHPSIAAVCCRGDPAHRHQSLNASAGSGETEAALQCLPKLLVLQFHCMWHRQRRQPPSSMRLQGWQRRRRLEQHSTVQPRGGCRRVVHRPWHAWGLPHCALCWWQQLTTDVVEAFPQEVELLAGGPLTRTQLLRPRGHGPLCLGSSGHKCHTVFERAGAAQAKAAMRGSVIWSITAR
jgi:hypothetical protein